MKKYKYLVLVLGIVLLTGCGKTKVVEKKISELSNIKNQMVNKLKDYSYEVVYEVLNQEEKINTLKLECSTDLNNRTAHCFTKNPNYDVEKYIDYDNRFQIYRNVYDNGNKMEWQYANRYVNSNPNHWLNNVDLISDLVKKEEKDGVYYTGIINRPIDFVNSLFEVYENARIEDSKLEVSVFINKDGNIESFKTKYDDDKKIEIIFKDFNKEISIEFPKV